MKHLPSIGNKIIELEEIDSTNSFLLGKKKYLKHHGLVITTKKQTSGRGRMGRKFLAYEDKTLTFSVAWHSKMPIDLVGIHSLMAGVAVAKSMEKYTKAPISLKWPNDVLIAGKKVCGILIEMADLRIFDTPTLVIGIGVNCFGNKNDFPEELKNKITTLEENSTNFIDIKILFHEILSQLDEYGNQLRQKGTELIVEQWLSRSNAIGKSILYEEKNEWLPGTIVGLDKNGYLLIETNSKEILTYFAGEILYEV